MASKWLVVTGGARGIGATIARFAAGAGYCVAVWDNDLPGAQAIAAEIGATALAFQVNVADEASVDAAFAAMPEVPAAVVNNAGVVRFGPLLGLATADWEDALRVNLTGTFLVSRAYARQVGEQAASAGCVVNIASINGVAAAPFAGAYSSSKAAIVMLTQQMALEWAPMQIRVNAVAPGLIDAGMSEPIYLDPDIRELRQSKVPLNRLGSAGEVAAAVMFLASDGASYITGQTIVVDGGITISALGSLARPASVDSVGA